MITGLSGNGDCVVAAHIAPARSKVKILRSIALTKKDIMSNRNGLLLSKNIEIAFDALQLSFIRAPVPDAKGLERDGFTLKIWDDTLIWCGSNKRIGEYDGHQLILGQHNPLKRALSNQAYTAFLHFLALIFTASTPSEYGTDYASLYYKRRKLMKDNLVRDVSEEADEDFDDDDI